MFLSAEEREEYLLLKDGIGKACALAQWAAITLIERNLDYFEKNISQFDYAREQIDRSMDYAESDNHRLAYMTAEEWLCHILREEPELIAEDGDMKSTMKELQEIRSSVIDPLWEKYQHKFKRMA